MIWTRIVFEPDFEEKLALIIAASHDREKPIRPAKKSADVKIKFIPLTNCQSNSWEEKHEHGLRDYLNIK